MMGTFRKHIFQRSSQLIGFFICEEYSMAPTKSKCISGYTLIQSHLSLHMCPLERLGFVGGAVQDPVRVYGVLVLAPHIKFA